MAIAKNSPSSMFRFWFKRWRAYLGLTQKGFAERWGVSLSMVQKIEANDYTLGQLSFERLERLREVLAMSPEVFYGILTQEEASTSNTVSIACLKDDLRTHDEVIAFPRAFIAEEPSDFLAFRVTDQFYANEEVYKALPLGSLGVLKLADTPTEKAWMLGRTQVMGHEISLIANLQEDNLLCLQSYNPKKDALTVELNEIEFMGIYKGHWQGLLW